MDVARGNDVERHLIDQRVDRVEALLAPQAFEEGDLQAGVVEVAGEVQQVGLDELAAPGDERRAHADADRGGVRFPAPIGGAGSA